MTIFSDCLCNTHLKPFNFQSDRIHPGEFFMAVSCFSFFYIEGFKNRKEDQENICQSKKQIPRAEKFFFIFGLTFHASFFDIFPCALMYDCKFQS